MLQSALFFLPGRRSNQWQAFLMKINWSQRSKQRAGKSRKSVETWQRRRERKRQRKTMKLQERENKRWPLHRWICFPTKCSRCQHLLHNDLHVESELMALICSSLCSLINTKARQLNRQHEPCFCYFCRCAEPFLSAADSHVHLITISRNHVGSNRPALTR